MNIPETNREHIIIIINHLYSPNLLWQEGLKIAVQNRHSSKFSMERIMNPAYYNILLAYFDPCSVSLFLPSFLPPYMSLSGGPSIFRDWPWKFSHLPVESATADNNQCFMIKYVFTLSKVLHYWFWVRFLFLLFLALWKNKEQSML